MSENGSAPDAQAQNDRAVQVCGPRPVPITYAVDVLRGSYPGGDPQMYMQLRLLSWNGEHVSYWDEQSLGALVKALRQMLRVIGSANSGIVTPDSGLILPPGTT